MLFKEILEKDEERYLFMNLCDLMGKANKIRYIGLKQLAEELNLKSISRLSAKFVTLEKLGVVKRENGYITVNKRHASKVTDDIQVEPIKNNNIDSKYVITVSKLNE